MSIFAFLACFVNIIVVLPVLSQAHNSDYDRLDQEINSIFASINGNDIKPKARNLEELILLTNQEGWQDEDLQTKSFTRNSHEEETAPQSLPTPITGSTDLPLPRFVSLRSNAVNVRNGPGREHAVNWRYVKKGLPVEIVSEFENWRRVRDSQGEVGWVLHSLLSSKRNALVRPWNKDVLALESIKSSPAKDAKTIAKLEPNVMVAVDKCNDKWCEVNIQKYKGWIEKEKLWGVYPDEILN